MAAGARARVAIDPSQPDLLHFAYDADGTGTFATRVPMLLMEPVVSQGPQLLSATIVGPETLPGAGPFGLNLALLFDRVVDATAAAALTNYSISNNGVQSARRQLSGRLVFASLERPEHTYVPTTLRAEAMPDGRGVLGSSVDLPLRSLLDGAGAVVSGRILNPDGTPVVGVRVVYQTIRTGRAARRRPRPRQDSRLSRPT